MSCNFLTIQQRQCGLFPIKSKWHLLTSCSAAPVQSGAKLIPYTWSCHLLPIQQRQSGLISNYLNHVAMASTHHSAAPVRPVVKPTRSTAPCHLLTIQQRQCGLLSDQLGPQRHVIYSPFSSATAACCQTNSVHSAMSSTHYSAAPVRPVAKLI
jgi:hypothetical protein